MIFIKISAVLLLTQLMLACSSMGVKSDFVSSTNSASSVVPIGSLKVFIDASAIGAAGATIKDIALTHSEASQSLVNSFKTRMSEAKVNALVKPFGSVTSTTTVDGSKTTTTLRAAGVNIEKMIAGESASSQPILILRIVSSQARNNVWNGMVSWRLDLVDPSVWTSKNNNTIWTGETRPMQFCPSSCSVDSYKLCADRLSEIVVAQLRNEKLIK